MKTIFRSGILGIGMIFLKIFIMPSNIKFTIRMLKCLFGFEEGTGGLEDRILVGGVEASEHNLDIGIYLNIYVLSM